MPKFRCPNCGDEVSTLVQMCPGCGREFDRHEIKELMTKQGKPNDKAQYGGYVVLALVGIVLYLVFAQFFGSDSSSSKRPKEDVGDALTAFVMSQEFVEEKLVAPGTAKFPYFDPSMATQVDKNTWIISSYVDSQNRFGALVRTKYRAKMQYIGNNQWKILDLNFSDW